MILTANQRRAQQYYQLSTQLAQMDNAQLAALLENSPPFVAWGRHQTLEIADTKLFVKRLPITEMEQQNPFSTQNLYDLPAYYHYGLGSAGFGVYRELVTHIKTTNWVLSGAIASFPLLYHYRLLPVSGERTAFDPERYQGYVKRWGSNEPIGQFVRDRANAQMELVLLLEHLPYTLNPWLLEHPDQVEWVLANLRATISFLRQNGIIHFDAHFYNMLTDGAHVYVTDFGLVLDQNFALRADERAFFASHLDYDYGQIIANLISPLYERYEALPAPTQQELRTRYGVPAEGNQFYKVLAVLRENTEALQASGLIQLPESYLAQLRKYRSIIALFDNFFAEMWPNPQKDTPFPSAELRRLLTEVGFIPDRTSAQL